MVVKNKENQAIPLAQVEELLIRDLESTNKAIAQIQAELASRRQERESLALMPAHSDPVSQARAMVEAEKKTQEISAEERALAAALAKLNAQAAQVQQELTQIQQQRDVSAAEVLLNDVNSELLAISTEIQKLRTQTRKLLLKANKLASQQAVIEALRCLGVAGAYIDIWLPSRDASSFDSPSLGKLSALKLVTDGNELKDHPPSQRWAVVSQSLVHGRDL